MKFSKIRYGRDEKVELEWTVTNGEDREHRSLSSKDEPGAGFKRALTTLNGDFVYLLELTGEAERRKVALTTLSVDEDRHGNWGFVFSGVREIDAGTHALSTPRMREPTDELKTGPTILTPDQVKRVDALARAAAKYVDGDRTQRRLPLEEPAEVAS